MATVRSRGFIFGFLQLPTPVFSVHPRQGRGYGAWFVFTCGPLPGNSFSLTFHSVAKWGEREREKKNLRVRRLSCTGFQNHLGQAGSVTGVVPALPGGGALHLVRSLQNPSVGPSLKVPGSEGHRQKRTSCVSQVSPDVPPGCVPGMTYCRSTDAGAGVSGAPEGPGKGLQARGFGDQALPH